MPLSNLQDYNKTLRSPNYRFPNPPSPPPFPLPPVVPSRLLACFTLPRSPTRNIDEIEKERERMREIRAMRWKQNTFWRRCSEIWVKEKDTPNQWIAFLINKIPPYCEIARCKENWTKPSSFYKNRGVFKTKGHYLAVANIYNSQIHSCPKNTRFKIWKKIASTNPISEGPGRRPRALSPEALLQGGRVRAGLWHWRLALGQPLSGKDCEFDQINVSEKKKRADEGVQNRAKPLRFRCNSKIRRLGWKFFKVWY